MLYQLMYSSQPRTEPAMAELQELLARARASNAAQQITGVLFLVDGVFVQILEGEKDAVTDLAARIGRDDRHQEMTVFHQQPIDRRAFSSWSMAYASPSAQDVAAWAQLEGSTRIQDVLDKLQRHPDRLPALARNILQAIGDS